LQRTELLLKRNEELTRALEKESGCVISMEAAALIRDGEIEALEKKADRLPLLETAIRKQHQELRTLRKKVQLLGLEEVAF